jgi:hypothetical protein
VKDSEKILLLPGHLQGDVVQWAGTISGDDGVSREDDCERIKVTPSKYNSTGLSHTDDSRATYGSNTRRQNRAVVVVVRNLKHEEGGKIVKHYFKGSLKYILLYHAPWVSTDIQVPSICLHLSDFGFSLMLPISMLSPDPSPPSEPERCP